ncbi:MAG: hypothetical protein WEB58_20965 [Planctomycetaceae bacterium]
MQFLTNGQLDRRWIFLGMLLAIASPILLQVTFPEKPSPKTIDVFNAIDQLSESSRVVIACDFDPASAGELEPMISAIVRHCALKRHRMIFLTLWLPGAPVIKSNIRMLVDEFPDYRSGIDYVDLGYQPGAEVVLKVLTSNFKKQCSSDTSGRNTADLPITAPLTTIQQVDLIVSVSTGFPGTTEWVQYVGSPHKVKMVGGTTAVSAPSLYAYIPRQLISVLGGIKGAAEYERKIMDHYPQLEANQSAREGIRRMGPQFMGHMLVVTLIVLGNILFFVEKRKGTDR